MTEKKFDKEIQDIAIRAASNGGPTIADVLNAVVALNYDLSTKMEEYSVLSVDVIDKHCKEYPHMTKDQFDCFVKDRNTLLESTNKTFFMWVLGSKAAFIGVAVTIGIISALVTEVLPAVFGWR